MKKIILPKALKNFYLIVSVTFLIWMLFIDSNDVISQWQLRNKLSSLEKEKNYYIEKIEEVHLERQELFGSDKQLEKFAREKYLMKKPNEDVYVLVD